MPFTRGHGVCSTLDMSHTIHVLVQYCRVHTHQRAHDALPLLVRVGQLASAVGGLQRAAATPFGAGASGVRLLLLFADALARDGPGTPTPLSLCVFGDCRGVIALGI